MKLEARLTAANVATLECEPGKSESIYWDPDLPGFGLRIRAGGSRRLIFQYMFGDKTRRMTLGASGAVDFAKIRRIVMDLMAEVRLGGDPSNVKRATREEPIDTFEATLPRFLERQRTRVRANTHRALTVRSRYIKGFDKMPVAAISRRMVVQAISNVTDERGAHTGNRVRSLLHSFFVWAIKAGLTETNPVTLTDMPARYVPRARYPNERELGAIWRALANDDYGDAMRLLILCASRKMEIGALRWSEIDFNAATITLPPERTKNNRPHVVPLSPLALSILQARPRRLERDGDPRLLVFGFSGKGFANWGNGKDALDARIALMEGAPLEPWHVHDLRRTVSTLLHERLGVQPHVVESVLGHISGHQHGVPGICNRATYFDERRRVMNAWAEFVLGLAKGESPASNVVKLR
jgi:integrase